jgi:tRNA (mo5U34)-methyltransferase
MRNAAIPADLAGLRVADIGGWNGCVGFECERRGAKEVTVLSLEDPEICGFNYLVKLTGSERTKYVRGSIYDLNPTALGLFDVVICFGVLYHLRYPVLGIDNLRRIVASRLFIETQILDTAMINPGTGKEQPIGELEAFSLLQFYKGKELNGDATNWFSPSMSALTGLIETAGFAVDRTLTLPGRGYLSATVLPGLPPFLDKVEGDDTYEGMYYDLSFARLFGMRDLWRR